ncbi:tyrosine-protein phosphatase [Roseivirga pacifica]|uniref:tyrosine-protein phosphatase n=1 Tax=Roseivirga pacifica TaxID=1267423 RepID=UPI003BA86FF1
MSLFSLFKRNKNTIPDLGPIEVDIHSHLVPAVDDGIQSIEQGLAILREMEVLGYKKVITTPHTMWGSYDNTPESILGGLEKIKQAAKTEGISITMEAASEYFLDEHFMERLESGQQILTFGKNYVLLETGFINEPPHLKEASFHLTMKGYKMVYAHPERYMYLQNNDKLIEELLDRDIVFQLNAVALTGCYSKPVQKLAERLIDMGAIRMVGTDCHNMGHINLLKEATKTKYWQKLIKLDLINNSL